MRGNLENRNAGGMCVQTNAHKGWRKRRIELSPISALHAYGDDIDDDGDFDPLQHSNSTCVSIHSHLGKHLFIFVWQNYIECFFCGSVGLYFEMILTGV